MQNSDLKNEQGKLLTIIATSIVTLIIILIFTNITAFSAVFRKLTQVLSSVTYGVVLAYLLNPLVKFVDTRILPVLLRRSMKQRAAVRISRVLGMLFAFVVSFFMIYALVYMIVPQLIESITGIVSNSEEYFRNFEAWLLNILEDNPQIKNYVDIALERAYEFVEDFIQNDLLGNVQSIVVGVTTSAYAIVRELINMAIGVVVSIYILLSKDKFQAQSKKMIVAFFSTERANRCLEIGRKINKIFNGFIIGKIIDSLIIGLLCYIGLAILKVPYAVLVATVIGITNVIPYFGPILGTIPCAILILMVDPLKCFYFIIFILILQQLDGNVIGPRILGENVGISGFWILVSITVGGGLFGFTGMLLGVPVFAVIYMLVGDAVDRSLGKKGHTNRTSVYYPIQTVDDLEIPQEEPEVPEVSAEEAAGSEDVPPESKSGKM